MKGLISGYNIDPSTTHEAQNAKVTRLFKNDASSGTFFVQYAFFDHSTSTMAAAGPARGELVPDMVDQ